ncbi:MAG: phosphate ABC transporter permease subunit PstC [Candidatus Promineifilaceae bacterium]
MGGSVAASGRERPYPTAAEVGAQLAKRPRFGETLIGAFLFLCGAVSIVTTLGIILVLGNESAAFFTGLQWDETNRLLLAEIGPAATAIEMGASGKQIAAGDVIRLEAEVMTVAAVQGQRLEVARGQRGSQPAAHAIGAPIYQAFDVSVVDFLSQTEWRPQLGRFGVWPLLTATLVTSAIGMALALPLGLASAIYLSEYASQRVRGFFKPILEVLAGIPTVIYGYFALTFMTPLLQAIFGQDVVQVYNMASAGIVIGILILPLVASMSEDALHAVPRSLREAALGLGATRLETSLRIVAPAAASGIAAAFVVAVSRAVGETMVVAIAAGAGPEFSLNPFHAAETITGHIVRISGGDLSYDSIDYNSIFALGLLLFVMTLGLNVLSRWIVGRFREAYE